LRVAYWGEDPADEIERRVAAILLHFKIPREKIEGGLFADSFRNQPLRVASLEKGEIVFPDADALTKALIESRIDVLILDPFVKTHGVSLKDAARCVRVMNRMTTAEAPAAQVKEKDRKRYFRVDDDGKANMTAPAEVATWFRLISVPLITTLRTRTPMETRSALPQAGNCRASLRAFRPMTCQEFRRQSRAADHGRAMCNPVIGQGCR